MLTKEQQQSVIELTDAAVRAYGAKEPKLREVAELLVKEAKSLLGSGDSAKAE